MTSAPIMKGMNDMALSSKAKRRLEVALAHRSISDEIELRLDGAAAVASVASADADATYGAPEATLINELKTQLNALLAAMRTAGLLNS
jgi:hypothetical protein